MRKPAPDEWSGPNSVRVRDHQGRSIPRGCQSAPFPRDAQPDACGDQPAQSRRWVERQAGAPFCPAIPRRAVRYNSLRSLLRSGGPSLTALALSNGARTAGMIHQKAGSAVTFATSAPCWREWPAPMSALWKSWLAGTQQRLGYNRGAATQYARICACVYPFPQYLGEHATP